MGADLAAAGHAGATAWIAVPRRFAWCLTLGGFYARIGLTTGLRPRLCAFTVNGFSIPQTTNTSWWLQRPLWALAPALCTVPLVPDFSPLEKRGRPARA